MRIQNRLDLGWIDVESGADDHFLGASDDIKAIRLELRQIAGIEPSIAVDDLGSQIRSTVVATHDVATAYVKFADITVDDRHSVEHSDPGLDSRQQRANGLIRARRVRPHARDTWCAL